MNPRAAVFDFDGLLADTAAAWRAAEEAVAGPSWSGQDSAALHGSGLDDAVATLRARVGGASDGVRARLLDAYRGERARVTLMPGAAVTVARLGARMPLAVATNSPPDVVVDLLGTLGLGGAFSTVAGVGPGMAAKPDPDVYLRACSSLGVAPSDVVALDDSQPGVDAARAAGCRVVGVNATRTLRGCHQVATLDEALHDALRSPDPPPGRRART